MDHAVRIGRLEPAVADELEAVVGIVYTVNDNVNDIADMRRRRGKALLLGDVDEALRALELHIVGNLVG